MAPDAFWTDRPTLVTGASGLVGSWLTHRLVSLGARVVVILRDWVPESELIRAALLDHVTVVRGDLCDAALVERVVAEYEIDTVMHLAAQTIVGIANRSPISTFETNIRGTWLLLEACRRAGTVKQIVVASSDKAYGEHAELPYTEETPLEGRHPYDVSKSCADLISLAYAKTFQLPVVVTRCGNFYGGGDLNWNRIVPGTIRSIVRGQRPIIRSDGEYVRDYFYVEDGASAYLRLAEALSSDPGLRGEALNFSNEAQIKVVDLVRRILSLMGSDLEPEIRNEATNEIRHQYLSAARARRLLGWSPQFDLDTGLRRTIAWYGDFFAQRPDMLVETPESEVIA